MTGDHRDLHVLTHSCPTRRSSDLPHSTGRWPRLTGWAQCKTDRSSSELMALAAFTGRALSATRHRQLVNRLFGLSEPAQTGAKRPRSSFRSEEHTSELQSLMRISYAVFCLQNKTTHRQHTT